MLVLHLPGPGGGSSGTQLLTGLLQLGLSVLLWLVAVRLEGGARGTSGR